MNIIQSQYHPDMVTSMHAHRITKGNTENGEFLRERRVDSLITFFTLSGVVIFLQHLFFVFYTQWSYDSELLRSNKIVFDTLVLSTVDLIALICVYRILGSRMIKSKVAKRFYSVLAISFLFASIAVSLYILISEQIGLVRNGYVPKISLAPVIFIVLPIQALYLIYWGIVFVRENKIRYVVPRIERAVFIVFSLITILAIIVGLFGITTTGGE